MNTRTVSAAIVSTILFASVVATCCQNREIKKIKQATQDSISVQRQQLSQAGKTAPFEIADAAIAQAKKVALKRI